MTRKFEGADQESLDLLKKMKDRGIESSYDRYDAQRMQTRLRRGILSVMLLPVAGVCLDWMHEKALAIGQYFVASGVFTVFGTRSPVAGAPEVDKFLCEGLEGILGGKWAFEPDIDKVVKLIIDHIEKNRNALGINVKKERKLYDMADRRALDAENVKTAQAGCEPGIAHSHQKKD